MMITGKIFFNLYRFKKRRIRNFVISMVKKLEGGELYSQTLRDIFKHYHKVTIGMYSWGGVFCPDHIDKYTSLGNYCSVARSAKCFNRNHPLDFQSTHSFFYNSTLGVVAKDPVDFIPLSIGNDVWLGENSLIFPNVTEIGTGSVIAAGAVVNKNIPPYAIVVGNPARIVRYRFPKEVIEELLESKWWEKPIKELKKNIDTLSRPVPLEKSI